MQGKFGGFGLVQLGLEAICNPLERTVCRSNPLGLCHPHHLSHHSQLLLRGQLRRVLIRDLYCLNPILLGRGGGSPPSSAGSSCSHVLTNHARVHSGVNCWPTWGLEGGRGHVAVIRHANEYRLAVCLTVCPSPGLAPPCQTAAWTGADPYSWLPRRRRIPKCPSASSY
eukprot:11235999-Alexandrium_andersonii.AAC.1